MCSVSVVSAECRVGWHLILVPQLCCSCCFLAAAACCGLPNSHDLSEAPWLSAPQLHRMPGLAEHMVQ